MCSSIMSIFMIFSFFHITLPFILQFCPFNKNVQREITGHTTQYYQNTTKGFEFTYANFKIKAVKDCKGR